MTTYPLATLAAQITATGISAPAYADVLASLQANYRGIYGSDVVLDASTQDGQWLAVQASAINDCNAAAIAVYNARSPSTAVGAGLSSVVKINGLARHVPSQSTATVTLVGQAFTLIAFGKIQDDAGNTWSLPDSVTIPVEGQVDVTATCDTLGAISAGANTITQIATPTLGWQTVTNAGAATPGAPVEDDPTLKRRQAASTSLPAQTPMQAIVGAVESVDGVTLVKPYENDTNTPDANGIPAYSMALVVEGGVNADVAAAIIAKKIPGGPTYGSTSVSTPDAYGVARTISFSRPAHVQIQTQVTLHPLTGYTSATGDSVKQAVVDYINALGIGDDVLLTRLYLPANLFGGANSSTFEVTGLQICIVGGSLGASDVTIAWNQLARADLAHAAIVTS